MNIFIKHVLAIIFIVMSQSVMAQKAVKAEHVDSIIHISLLTCQAGQEVYSLYGHTAIHYVNVEKGIDVAINYGMFSFSKPFFIASM